MSQFPLMWKKYRIFLSLIVGRWQQLGLQIHHSSPGLWWDWKLFVFVICTRERLFTVIGSASEHLKSQSKQSSNNSCCLDISSLLRKLERKKICVSSVLSHYECDRIMTNDFNMFLCKNDKKISSAVRESRLLSLWNKNNKWKEFEGCIFLSLPIKEYQYQEFCILFFWPILFSCLQKKNWCRCSVFRAHGLLTIGTAVCCTWTPLNELLYWKTKCCNLLGDNWEPLIFHRLIDCKNVCP